MVRALAVNIGANTNAPGFRGPIYADGSFEYVPIPETKPTNRAPPTYADLDLGFEVPAETRDVPVHLDPEFAEYTRCERYTYGDPHGVKARPLLELERGDYVFFYATLKHRGDSLGHNWVNPDWGAYVIGQFELARDPLSKTAYEDADRDGTFENNAHAKRDPFDAEVLLEGDPKESGLYETAIPLSDPERGVDANRIVTDLSADSGKGPWWRRPLRFDDAATAELLDIRDDRAFDRCFRDV